jgi:hypothetical protein
MEQVERIQVLVTTNPLPSEALAAEIARYGGLERAIAALANDASALLPEALAYQAALAEQADPARRIARLLTAARDLDARAEPAWAEAAEMHGKAAHRRLNGDPDLAQSFLRRAIAAERLAAALEADAFARRLEAARMEASSQRQQELAGLLRALAA